MEAGRKTSTYRPGPRPTRTKQAHDTKSTSTLATNENRIEQTLSYIPQEEVTLIYRFTLTGAGV